jgi:very-short-patch-repair endonuclease
MTEIYNRRELKYRRQELRNNMPPAEVILWQRLRGKQLLGYKFRRQYSVGPYVLDFYCPTLRLAIELDGDSHFWDGAKQKDRERDEYIRGCGIHVLRFLNPDVYENLEGLLEVLVGAMRQREAEQPVGTDDNEMPDE